GSFILLQANPGEAYQDGPTHPSFAKRVHAIFWVLSKMDQAAGDLVRPFRALIDLLRNLCKQSRLTVGEQATLPAAEAALLEARLGELYNLLAGTTSGKLVYQFDDWLRAQALADALHPDKTWSPTAWPSAETRRDVLNAAWLCRLQQG